MLLLKEDNSLKELSKYLKGKKSSLYIKIYSRYNSSVNKNSKETTILSIDTSCDETSVAVLRGSVVLSNLLPSQAAMHRKWGGVVPSLAKLAHQERIDGVVERALKLAGIKIEDIDVFAVTYGPGLAIALEVGIKKAQELASKYEKPLVTINHMEGHLYSAFAEKKTAVVSERETGFQEFNYPVLGALISGGHTEFILVKDFGNYELIGETLDDACGEAFDKCGRILGLGYPAGPAITRFAKEHRENVTIEYRNDNHSYIAELTNISSKKKYQLPVPMANTSDFNLSYSGLKSAFSRLVSENELTKEFVIDMCVLFEAVAIKQITLKMERILKKYNVNEIWLGGGVVASPRLRSEIRKTFKETVLKAKKGKGNKNLSNIKPVIRYPYSKKLTGDNAGMIGIVASLKVKKYGVEHNPKAGIYTKEYDMVDRDPSLSLS
jgi:N6-L-threonylcarbamoyladenine synthase